MIEYIKDICTMKNPYRNFISYVQTPILQYRYQFSCPASFVRQHDLDSEKVMWSETTVGWKRISSFTSFGIMQIIIYLEIFMDVYLYMYTGSY